ncbi:MAG: ATP-binding protein, partial [Ruminococcus sp.]|nr:ATP-binding protein [Ruminococcus sp.]
LTQFRDRGDEIRVYPISFREYCELHEGDRRDAWTEYYTYGGMPVVFSKDSYYSSLSTEPRAPFFFALIHPFA